MKENVREAWKYVIDGHATDVVLKTLAQLQDALHPYTLLA